MNPATPGLPPWHIAILIPARDEEALLPRCLRSVERTRAALLPGITTDVVFIADRCTDDTLNLARRHLRNGVGAATPCNYGNVGRARALAADIALSRYRGPLDRCWLANTDADCELPETWLVDQLRLAESGCEAVAGVVDVDSFDEHPLHVPQRFRETYLLHPDGTHPHVHGANLGVRADAYTLAGGWRGLATAEDHDLWNRLQSHGRACVSVASLSVITSGRITGRAPDGFAGALAAHGTPASVEAIT